MNGRMGDGRKRYVRYIINCFKLGSKCLMKLIILLLKKLILRYEINHPNYEDPIYICTHIDTRNNAKNDKYKIPPDQPQCPIYKDNRCCGGCKYTSICDHCVECRCYGHVYSAMGGNDKKVYLRKASEYAIGRLNNNGKFDWEYYYYKGKNVHFKKVCILYVMDVLIRW